MDEREKYGVVALTCFAIVFIILSFIYDNKQNDDFITQCQSISKQLNGTILYKTSEKCYIKKGNDIIQIDR